MHRVNPIYIYVCVLLCKCVHTYVYAYSLLFCLVVDVLILQTRRVLVQHTYLYIEFILHTYSFIHSFIYLSICLNITPGVGVEKDLGGIDVWPCGIVCCSLCGLTHPPSIRIHAFINLCTYLSV